jgi:hypothetical protein
MRAFVLVLALGMAALVSADTYVVQHRRPSFILGVLTNHRTGGRVLKVVGNPTGLVMPGVTMTADDKASTITIEGPTEQVQEMRRMLAEFDVEPRMVGLRLVTRNIEDKYTSETTTQLSNNSAWTIRDERAGLEITLKARINGDGTITGVFEFVGTATKSMVLRAKNGESFTFGFDEGAFYSQDVATKEWRRMDVNKPSDPKERPSMLVSVRFDLPNLPASGKIDPR